MEVLTSYLNSRQASDLQLSFPVGRPPRPTPASDGVMRPWSLCDRLSDAELQAVVRDRRNGLSLSIVAYKYKISISSVKRIMQRSQRVRTSGP